MHHRTRSYCLCRETLKQARAELASATWREQELRKTLEQKEKRLSDIEASTEDTQKKVNGISHSRSSVCLCFNSRGEAILKAPSHHAFLYQGQGMPLVPYIW